MERATRLDTAGSPAHIAIIMDGNGRWANARGKPRTYGHKRGVDAVRRTIEAAIDLGVAHLTLFAFSSENWKRPVEEVSELMRLLRFYLHSEVAELHRNGVRIRMLGDKSGLAKDIADLIDHAENVTRENSTLNLCIALNYGGRQEIVRAARALCNRSLDGEIDPAAVDETTLGQFLYAPEVPDPDLIIRTSGEKRISNFLLWQAAYAEFMFVDTLWPDFGREDLERAIAEFRSRERRFGAVGGT